MTLESYSSGRFAAYFIVLLLVNHLTDNWVYYEFPERVRSGLLSSMLLRPLHPIHADLAQNLTNKCLMLTVILPTMALLTLLFSPSAQITPLTLLAFLPTLALVMALRFIVERTLGLAAFWVTQMDALIQVYYIALFFLSGQLAPLALYPAPLQELAQLLPFRWMVAFPVEVLLGELSAGSLGAGFAAQGIWLCLSLGLLTLLWKFGLRRYSATGA